MMKTTAIAVALVAGALAIPEPPPVVPPFPVTVPALEPPDPVAALVEMDADILAGVATAEDPHAAAAVAWVVLNRAGCRFLESAPAPGYSCVRPLLEVATARDGFGTVRVWAGDSAPSWRPSWRPGRGATARAEAVALEILAGALPDPTGGATHFHRVGTWVPPWAPGPRARQRFGSHEFYKAL